MKATIVINGTTQLILEPENEIDNLMLKQLNGCQVRLATDTLTLLNRRIEGAAVIDSSTNKPTQGEPKEQTGTTPTT